MGDVGLADLNALALQVLPQFDGRLGVLLRGDSCQDAMCGNRALLVAAVEVAKRLKTDKVDSTSC